MVADARGIAPEPMREQSRTSHAGSLGWPVPAEPAAFGPFA